MPNTILPLGSDVDVSTVVQVNCENGYYNNIQQDVTTVCLQTGNWSQVYSSLCKSMYCVYKYVPKNNDDQFE